MDTRRCKHIENDIQIRNEKGEEIFEEDQIEVELNGRCKKMHLAKSVKSIKTGERVEEEGEEDEEEEETLLGCGRRPPILVPIVRWRPGSAREP